MFAWLRQRSHRMRRLARRARRQLSPDAWQFSPRSWLVSLRRWQAWQRNLYILVGAEMVAILGFSISNPFLPFYIQELGVTQFGEVAFWVGLINSGAPIAMALSSPIWGLIADRYGRKPMLVRAMLGGSGILGLLAVAGTVQQVAALRIVQGALTGTIAAATTLVATTVPRQRCGYSLGLLQTAVFIGSSLGPSVGGFIGGTFGYRAAFLGSGLLLLLAGLCVVLLVREKFVPPPQKQSGNALLTALQRIAGEPVLLSMVALLMLLNLSGSITGPVLPLYVQTLVPNMQEASTATGMILGATALTNALAAVWIGRSADQLGRRRALLACLSVASLVYFPQMLTRHPLQLLVLRAILGFAMGAVGPIANAVIAERAPEGRQGGIYGISTSLNALGSALGPMLGTFIVTGWSIGGVFPATGTLLGLVVLMVALTGPALDRPRRGPASYERCE